jgi:hypothetical protein
MQAGRPACGCHRGWIEKARKEGKEGRKVQTCVVGKETRDLGPIQPRLRRLFHLKDVGHVQAFGRQRRKQGDRSQVSRRLRNGATWPREKKSSLRVCPIVGERNEREKKRKKKKEKEKGGGLTTFTGFSGSTSPLEGSSSPFCGCN